MSATTTYTVGDLLAIAEMHLLEDGGIDNWDWYSEAMEDYNASDDAAEDAANFLNALTINGADNWAWYDESRTGLAEYEEYLRALDELGKLSEALNIDGWKALPEPAAEEPTPEPVVVEPAPVLPAGAGNEALYNHIVSQYGEESALDIFFAAKDAGVWSRNTFEKDFEVATKVLKNHGSLADAQVALIAQVAKNGKLNTFLNKVKTSLV
jgi:hypothetical protein